MKVGVTIPNNFGLEDPLKVIELAQLAEELGYDSVWVMDHLFNAGYIGQRLGDTPYYHPLSILSYVAAKTSRVTLGTSVIVLPYHHPVELAKYAATLDHLSGGRLILGVGVGAIPEEFEALGVPFNRRGSMASEAILAMKELWTQPFPSFEGRHWSFSELPFSPRPLQKPHIPVWVGGNSPAGMKRAATLGEGWHPNAIAPEECAAAFQACRDQATAAGRDGAALAMSVRINVVLQARTDRPGRVTAEPEALRPYLAAYKAAGVDHALLALDWGDVDQLAEMMTRTAKEVLPAVR